ncbi:hypothetical protein [Thermoleptolyngbya sp. C42_A2020_037]|uniref:DUF7219 family protein n=1 Tax=Thermoleptolyngbya sp. C42_A2020_037 TaxID=2747799 RepID=UPI0019F0F45A|nr:hypothetical protein [Thermoleptolyngbya sp. C42_A2020_037]MBF2083001.1 hypothetical protein [Thermoleptolyngbya sp. C42_A2020_037]
MKKTQLQQFAGPIARYRGVKDPFSVEFNAHLQSFAHRVSLLACLHTGGKLSTQESYQQLLTLWDELQPYLSLVADDNQRLMLEPGALDAQLPLNGYVGDRLSSALDGD